MNHYEILSLPTPSGDGPPSPATLKTAYHRTLLRFHPDKALRDSELAVRLPEPEHGFSLSKSAAPPPTIDEIKHAYATLADPESRRVYDRDLLLRRNGAVTTPDGTLPSGTGRDDDGLETVDLEEMAFDEARERWSWACRCGEEEGFVVTEGELEGALVEGRSTGELVVGCRGCSLWIRVTFGVA
ncbi:hypothetical protein P152DRAFT_198019 [Eremomyces bilateralis CBS 781.70]|uniref:Diphthamide biosynthesis protein 4 n=1 Tax=Eremomyces bilateralis CBS 781.70 TaxID=1392243 RepID=A0A6G1GCL9_9PEZI|nr:uncharacterized protein P152DRAFT_198019 [Eremomyces bilateralis CBS 781.70]KAF1815838.1 hypothetical protein P152DRAFT_198019 [Eremomyces bilateralis CBS 781.70]